MENQEKFRLLHLKAFSALFSQFHLRKQSRSNCGWRRSQKSGLTKCKTRIQRALQEYRALGYSENWINQRLKSVEIRKDLTDEWKKHGLKEGVQFATLTDIIYKTWAGKTAKEYKEFKGLKKENLRDNMTNKELVLNMLAELSTKEISESKNPKSFGEHIQNAVDGATIAKNARAELEQKTGKKVVTPLNAKDGIGLIQDTKMSVLEEDEESK